MYLGRWSSMYRYAQISSEGICFAVSDLHSPVEHENLIPVESTDVLGMRWTGEAWEDVE